MSNHKTTGVTIKEQIPIMYLRFTRRYQTPDCRWHGYPSTYTCKHVSLINKDGKDYLSMVAAFEPYEGQEFNIPLSECSDIKINAGGGKMSESMGPDKLVCYDCKMLMGIEDE